MLDGLWVTTEDGAPDACFLKRQRHALGPTCECVIIVLGMSASNRGARVAERNHASRRSPAFTDIGTCPVVKVRDKSFEERGARRRKHLGFDRDPVFLQGTQSTLEAARCERRRRAGFGEDAPETCTCAEEVARIAMLRQPFEDEHARGRRCVDGAPVRGAQRAGVVEAVPGRKNGMRCAHELGGRREYKHAYSRDSAGDEAVEAGRGAATAGFAGGLAAGLDAPGAASLAAAAESTERPAEPAEPLASSSERAREAAC